MLTALKERNLAVLKFILHWVKYAWLSLIQLKTGAQEVVAMGYQAKLTEVDALTG